MTTGKFWLVSDALKNNRGGRANDFSIGCYSDDVSADGTITCFHPFPETVEKKDTDKAVNRWIKPHTIIVQSFKD